MEMEFYRYKARSISTRVLFCKAFLQENGPCIVCTDTIFFYERSHYFMVFKLTKPSFNVCFSDKHCICPAKGSFRTNGETVGSQLHSWSFHEPDSCGQTGHICSQQPLLWLPSQALSQVSPSSSLRNSSSSAFLASAPDSPSVSIWPLGTGHLRSRLSVQFSHSVISNFLQPRGLHHTRLPCSSSTPGACLNSCPSSR